MRLSLWTVRTSTLYCMIAHRTRRCTRNPLRSLPASGPRLHASTTGSIRWVPLLRAWGKALS